MKKQVIVPDIVEDTPSPENFAIQLSEGKCPAGRGDILALGTMWHQHIEDNLKLSDNYRRQALFGILKLGELLSKVRAQCPQGEWSKLFSDSQKRLKSSSNANHDSHLPYTSRTAEKYIKAYEAAVQNLKAVERKTFASLPYHERSIAPETEKLVEKATKGAETMTQMYLNLGVIKPREATHITNFKGGKAGAEANARMREELATVDQAEEETPDPQELHDQAMRDGNELMRLLERYFVTEKRAEHLSSGEREALCHAVIEYGKFGKNSNYKMKLSL